MIAGDRLSVMTFALSLLLHLLAVISMQTWTWMQPLPAAPRKTRYVIRLPSPTPTPAPVATPEALPTPASTAPTSVAPSVHPQTPKAIERVSIEPLPTPVPEVLPTPVKPRVRPLLAAPAPRPTTPQKHLVKPAQRLARPSPTRTAPVAPPPVQPVPPQVAAVAPPRQPSSNWQRTSPSQPQPADTDSDPLKAYLHRIFQALEKHKHYPEAARRRAINGYVVLQFVVFADGRVVAPKIAKSDGPELFHRAALRALSLAGQMPPFPPDIRRNRLLVEVPISYQVKTR
jgi:protein TonB